MDPTTSLTKLLSKLMQTLWYKTISLAIGILSTACLQVEAAVDQSFVGTWRTALPSNLILVWKIEVDGRYDAWIENNSSFPHETGIVDAENGRWTLNRLTGPNAGKPDCGHYTVGQTKQLVLEGTSGKFVYERVETQQGSNSTAQVQSSSTTDSPSKTDLIANASNGKIGLIDSLKGAGIVGLYNPALLNKLPGRDVRSLASSIASLQNGQRSISHSSGTIQNAGGTSGPMIPVERPLPGGGTFTDYVHVNVSSDLQELLQSDFPLKSGTDDSQQFLIPTFDQMSYGPMQRRRVRVSNAGIRQSMPSSGGRDESMGIRNQRNSNAVSDDLVFCAQQARQFEAVRDFMHAGSCWQTTFESRRIPSPQKLLFERRATACLTKAAYDWLNKNGAASQWESSEPVLTVMRAYENMYAIDSTNPTWTYLWGQLLCATGQYVEARVILQTGISCAGNTAAKQKSKTLLEHINPFADRDQAQLNAEDRAALAAMAAWVSQHGNVSSSGSDHNSYWKGEHRYDWDSSYGYYKQGN